MNAFFSNPEALLTGAFLATVFIMLLVALVAIFRQPRNHYRQFPPGEPCPYCGREYH
jgi:hypothetical protein